MNRQGLFSVLAFFITLTMWSQTTNLSGYVTDNTGTPVTNAQVNLGTQRSVLTNSSGQYAFKDVPNGKYSINIRYFGFKTISDSISLIGGFQTFDASLMVDAIETISVDVTGVRVDRDAPFTHVTRNRQDIERIYTGQDGAFLLEELSPSIVSYSEGGTNLSNYGGFRLRGIDQTRINMTLNGVPLNDMIDQGVFFSNFSDFGNSIESVQIQRGVGTTSHGTSSYAGSINFESINLMDTVPRAEVQLTGGSFNTRRASVEGATGRLKNNTAFYVRYSNTTSDGFRDNMSTNSESFFFSGGWAKGSHSLKATGFFGRSQNGLGYFPVSIDDINANPRTNYNHPDDVDDFSQWLAQLQHSFEINREWTLTNTLYYAGAGGDFPYNETFEDGSRLSINYPLRNDHYGVMSVLKGTFENVSLTTGLHANLFDRENIEEDLLALPENRMYYQDFSRKNELSGFVKGSYDLGNLFIYGDVQVRYVSLQLGGDDNFLGEPANIPLREWVFVNPKVGATYKLNNESQVYASFGRTGREPTRFDILGSVNVNPGNIMVARDPNLVVPEYVNNLETGYRFRNRFINLQLNGFYMQFENEIAPIGEFITESFVQIYENMTPSYRYGLEVDYVVRFTDYLRLMGNATWMQANIESYTDNATGVVFENVTPILTPEWNVQSTLEATVWKDLRLAVRTRYLSEAFMELTNNSDLVVPQSFITDLRASYTFVKWAELSIQFNNIFDVQYFTYGAPIFGENDVRPGFFVQPPRHIYATLRLMF
ncbi:MAG: TonB-dependent receptor [Cryomorphaceae bacterium]|nr:TonB-dependent receptor [Cryomorphaceae bacterium]